MLDITEIRQAARACGCPIADLLGDPELDALIMTVVVSAEACGHVLVQQEWSLALPASVEIAELPISDDVP